MRRRRRPAGALDSGQRASLPCLSCVLARCLLLASPPLYTHAVRCSSHLCGRPFVVLRGDSLMEHLAVFSTLSACVHKQVALDRGMQVLLLTTVGERDFRALMDLVSIRAGSASVALTCADLLCLRRLLLISLLAHQSDVLVRMFLRWTRHSRPSGTANCFAPPAKPRSGGFGNQPPRPLLASV